MSTAYHSQYWAHALTLRGSGGDIAALSRSIANARVDLNPHQIDAALFALRSPFTNGAILADEVGLGKTVEAGIVLSQKWAERRRRILIVVPAMLRKQWQQELSDKFFIPSEVLDTQVTSRLRKNGGGNPFDQKNKAVICSYNFAAARASSVAQVPWDMVVIDEAHRLRNVHRSRTRLQNNPASRKTMAHQIADAVGKAPKLLLTATPLQNSLLELFSLVSVIDPHVFGDAASFREQFVNSTDELSRNVQLKQRIAPVCTRALRKQVTEYIPFTNRVPITQEFLPSEQEQNLYDSITTYLQRDVLYALPASQRQLITMVLRKLLASSTFAIARTLRSLAARLENLRDDMDLLDDDDIEGVTELADEYAEDAEDEGDAKIDPEQLKGELADLRRYADLASCIGRNAKGDALLPALKTAFAKAEALGAPRKAVIFTESRETQTYLYDLLSANGYEGQVATINGTNNQPHHADIYQRWQAKHEGTDRLSGSRAVDMKAAIVEHFRDEATILVATEAAAEGVNLQFCSLVVNFDLPWNPQRIEQRIGRCHRYGQKHDVVVVNFLNRRNEADKRVYELLSEKFRLFDGVFGASDEVLGALESGVDIERRIADVYQTCRTNAEIQAAFDALQAELDAKIQARLAATRQALMENFDEDVRSRLKISREKTLECLSQRERWLLDLTRVELDGQAQFDPQMPRFLYSGDTPAGIRQGWYNLDWKAAEAADEHFYRPDHPLAHRLIERAIARRLPIAEVALDYTNHPAKISVIEPLVGQSGWLEVSRLTVEAVEVDEFLVLAARTDHNQVLDEEICRKLLSLPATLSSEITDAPDLAEQRKAEVSARLGEIDTRNGLPLVAAVEDYLRARAIAGTESLAAMAADYSRYFRKVVREATVPEVVAHLLRSKAQDGTGARHISQIKSVLGRFAAAHPGPILEVTTAHVDEWLRGLRVSLSSRNSMLRYLKLFFFFAAANDYLPEGRATAPSGVGKARVVGGDVSVFTPEQMRTILHAAPPHLVPILAVGAFSGIRMAELARLDWSAVNLERRIIEVRAGQAKTASRRVIPITDNLRAWLAPLPRRGKVLPHQSLQREVTALAKSLGIAWPRNVLRHSFISYRIAMVQSADQVALEAGNSPAVIFKHYRELATSEQAGEWFSILPKDGQWANEATYVRSRRTVVLHEAP